MPVVLKLATGLWYLRIFYNCHEHFLLDLSMGCFEEGKMKAGSTDQQSWRFFFWPFKGFQKIVSCLEDAREAGTVIGNSGVSFRLTSDIVQKVVPSCAAAFSVCSCIPGRGSNDETVIIAEA